MFFVAKIIPKEKVSEQINLLVNSDQQYLEVFGFCHDESETAFYLKLGRPDVVVISHQSDRSKYRYFVNPKNPTINAMLSPHFPHLG